MLFPLVSGNDLLNCQDLTLASLVVFTECYTIISSNTWGHLVCMCSTRALVVHACVGTILGHCAFMGSTWAACGAVSLHARLACGSWGTLVCACLDTCWVWALGCACLGIANIGLPARVTWAATGHSVWIHAWVPW